jgi:glycosyltransferase involved in cell wall biosynthesis
MKKDKIGNKKKRHWIQNSVKPECKRIIVRHCGNKYPSICDYFIKIHGFCDIYRLHSDTSLKSKIDHFKDLLFDMIYVLKNLKRIREAREIIAFGTMAANIALLLKVGLLPACRNVYWFGLFIHNPRWLRFLRFPFHILNSTRIRYVLFSNFEKRLYTESLSLKEDSLYYIPYGDMSQKKGTTDIKEASEINKFKALPYKLVIICSKLNTEIDESVVPSNIKVLRDVSSEDFDTYVKDSKACIIPIAHDTGAAGQSCLLRYMKNKKIIIATDTGIIREYVKDGVSGMLVKDNHKALSMAVCAVAANTKSYQSYADAAYERFVCFFSGEAIARRLDDMINQNTNEPSVSVTSQ